MPLRCFELPRLSSPLPQAFEEGNRLGGRFDQTIRLGFDGQRSYLVHYTPGHPLTEASLPDGPNTISIEAVAAIPGTAGLLAGGDTHAYGNPGRNVVAVLLQDGI